MPTDKLTDPKIRQAKPADKPYKLFDGGGLFLLVQPGGSKLWRLKYRFGGKEKLLAIGSYDKGVSLKKAREERDKAREQLVEGIDPAASRKKESLPSGSRLRTPSGLLRLIGQRRTQDPSVNHSLPRFGCFWGTFSPSCRQIRSTRLWFTIQPSRRSKAVMRR